MSIPEFTLPDHNVVELRGLRFHYVDWGNRHATPILFLHGGGLTARTWDLVCLSLRPDYRCVAVDLRGHGDTDWAADRDYQIDAHIADVEAIADHLDLDAFVLVGMSLGAKIGFGYAARHANLLRALVLIDSGPGSSRINEGAIRIRDFIAKSPVMPTIEAFIDRALEFNPTRDRRLLRRSLLHNLRQLPDGQWTWKYDQDGLVASFRSVRGRKDLWTQIPRVTCPTLVVRGSRSNVFSDNDAARLAAALPNGRWSRVENAGHTIQGDNPRELAEVLRGFILSAFQGF